MNHKYKVGDTVWFSHALKIYPCRCSSGSIVSIQYDLEYNNVFYIVEMYTNLSQRDSSAKEYGKVYYPLTQSDLYPSLESWIKAKKVPPIPKEQTWIE